MTQTLVVALQGVRLVDRDMLMWADQICINQRDDAEKSDQVNRMNVIYSQARFVLCWLGEDDGTVAQAFDVLKRWAAARGEGKAKEELRIGLAIKSQMQPSQEGGGLDALKSLFSRPWWRRAWTLQEVCPSEFNRPILVCGQHRLVWLDFYMACLTMFETLPGEQKATAFSTAIEHVLDMLTISWGHKDSLRLSNLAPMVDKREASDPRDKIHALLGISARFDLCYPPADYALSADQVCIRYTRAAIKVDRSLDILLAINNTAEHRHLPKWAIKLDRAEHRTYRIDEYAVRQRRGDQCFKATMSWPPLLDADEGDFDKILRLRGLPIDTIESLAPIDAVLSVLRSEQQTWTAALDRLADHCQEQDFASKYAATGRDVVEVMLDTLTLRDFFMLRSDPESQQPFKRRGWQALYTAYQQDLRSKQSNRLAAASRSSGVSQSALESLARELCSFESRGRGLRRISGQARRFWRRKERDAIAWLDMAAVEHLLDSIRVNSDGHCLFMTCGGYIGLGPGNARPGDHVCLLLGGSTPFLLHPVQASSGAAYELVDGVYCEGFMMGEGLRGHVSNGELRAPEGGWTTYALV